MKKIIIGEPKIVSQNPDVAILFEGWQDPYIRQRDGVLYVTFNSRRDCNETVGLAEQNPLYRSTDKGEKKKKVSDYEEFLKSNV